MRANQELEHVRRELGDMEMLSHTNEPTISIERRNLHRPKETTSANEPEEHTEEVTGSPNSFQTSA